MPCIICVRQATRLRANPVHYRKYLDKSPTSVFPRGVAEKRAVSMDDNRRFTSSVHGTWKQAAGIASVPIKPYSSVGGLLTTLQRLLAAFVDYSPTEYGKLGQTLLCPVRLGDECFMCYSI